MNCSYDAVLVVSFGGPEGVDQVMPFLENVLRGTDVPRRRMLEVARGYERFGGVSPINGQNRALIAALEDELAGHHLHLPVYWGNRNWHPLLEDTMRKMADGGIRRALAFVTAAYSSYSTCRQYLEDIERARGTVGPGAPQVEKLRVFYNHPGFIEPMAEGVKQALQVIPEDRQCTTRIIFTAHSIPVSMARGCRYEGQLKEACRLVCQRLAHDQWTLVYQSRSGPPTQPWLEPDLGDYLKRLPKRETVTDVVVVPIGFICDHMEVVYDLDVTAKVICDQIGLNMVRAATVGTHPRFVAMIRQLIVERITDRADRPAIGSFGPGPDVCPADCCPPPLRRASPSRGAS